MKNLIRERELLEELGNIYWNKNLEGMSVLPSMVVYLPKLKSILKRIQAIEKEIKEQLEH